MLDKVPVEVLWAISSIFGGLTRLALGIRDNNVTVKGEVFRVFAVSLPMGWVASHYVSVAYEMSDASFAVGYFIGIASLNIARTVATQGIAGVFDVLSKIRGG